MALFKQKIISLLITMICLCSVNSAQSMKKTEQTDTTPKLSDYELIQYIATSGSSPQSISKLDNNSEILIACIDGKTREQLKSANIRFNESQIKLLKTWRILKEDKKILKTGFPILAAKRTQRLRAYTKTVAPKIGRLIEPKISELVTNLKSIHRESNTYSIVFSYVLDGLVWKNLERKKILDERNITAESPFWNGEVWALYPSRKFSMGNNNISDKGVTMKVNWTRKAIPKMMPFVADFKNLLKMFDNYIEMEEVRDEEAKKVFAPFNLFDKNGKMTIPIIIETSNNSIYKSSRQISELVVREIPNLLNLETITKEFGFRDNKQTLIIVYHELMWGHR